LKVQIGFLEKGKITPQKCIKAFEAVVKLITSKKAKAAAEKFGIDLKQAIPIKKISGRKEKQFVNFVEHRLSRI
jgi:hypothetical protein